MTLGLLMKRIALDWTVEQTENTGQWEQYFTEGCILALYIVSR